ncbi:MAG: hypothetical protein DRG24_00890 [Epsilonproteobacteria bacterium]|nr:MAG: hypothetical protein DRG24_00890 [Campylobacterota bacterium]
MIKITKKVNKAWVTFTLASDAGSTVSICGEWNDWEKEPMKIKKSGEFYITKVIKPDRSYAFGYLVNDGEWLTENELPKIPSPFNSNNSLLEL